MVSLKSSWLRLLKIWKKKFLLLKLYQFRKKILLANDVQLEAILLGRWKKMDGQYLCDVVSLGPICSAILLIHPERCPHEWQPVVSLNSKIWQNHSFCCYSPVAIATSVVTLMWLSLSYGEHKSVDDLSQLMIYQEMHSSLWWDKARVDVNIWLSQ